MILQPNESISVKGKGDSCEEIQAAITEPCNVVGGQVAGDFRYRQEATPSCASLLGMSLCPPSHAVNVTTTWRF